MPRGGGLQLYRDGDWDLGRQGGLLMSLAAREVGLLIECDGVLVDLNTDGHRVAFNRAFKDLGLECADWSPQVYHDLRRGGDGTAEGMVAAFFNKIGWPMAVATTERKEFVTSVLKYKKKNLRKLLEEDKVPLRPGCLEFIDAALESGAKLGIISCTLSDVEDDVMGWLARQIGGERTRKLRVFPQQPGKELPGMDADSGFDELHKGLQDSMAEVKRREAEAFVSTVASIESDSLSIRIDPALVAGPTPGVTTPWLAAVVAAMGCSLKDCAVVVASNGTAQTASAAGAVSLAVPAGLSRRGSFPDAAAVFDGFGAGGGLTWNRVAALLDDRASG
eukprot:evm.model.scf_68EXC.9 EVM.evm.TU.scf_68EXC.9   scf_68EXC:123378-131661(+)